MTLRINSATTIKSSTTVGFSPASLFAAGEQGVWYDPSDLSTMFTDAAGVTGVAAPGSGSQQLVGSVLDKRNLGASTAFSGTNDRFSASSADFAFGTGDFTVEAWAYSSNVTAANQKGLFQTSNVSGGLSTSYTTGIAIYYGTPVNGAIGVDVGGTLYSPAGSVLTANAWYHIAATRASGTVRLFVNGVIVASGTGNTSNLTGQNACVGGYYDTSFLLPGNISNIRVVKGTALYTSNFTVPTGPLQPISGTALLTCGNAWSGNPTFTLTGSPTLNNANPFGASTGNFATQSTAGNRPELSARVNLYLQSNNFATTWTSQALNGAPSQTIAAPDGTTTAWQITENTSSAVHGVVQSSINYIAGNYTIACYISAKSGSSQRYIVIIASDAVANGIGAVFNPNTGAFVTYQSIGSGWSSVSNSTQSVGGGWYLVSFTFTAPTQAGGNSGILLSNTTSSFWGSTSYIGDNSSGANIWRADLRASNDGVGLPAYQRVNTSTDYDTTGFPFYLAFDGSSSYMTLPNNCMSDLQISNQPFAMWAGGRRYATDFSNFFNTCDNTNATGSNNDSLSLAYINATNQVSGLIRDFTGAFVDKQAYGGTLTVPATNVISWNRSSTTGQVSVNTVAGTAADQTQPALNLVLYTVGALRRGSGPTVASYMNGRIYSLIVRVASTTSTQISNTENWVNTKTKAY